MAADGNHSYSRSGRAKEKWGKWVEAEHLPVAGLVLLTITGMQQGKSKQVFILSAPWKGRKGSQHQPWTQSKATASCGPPAQASVAPKTALNCPSAARLFHVTEEQCLSFLGK